MREGSFLQDYYLVLDVMVGEMYLEVCAVKLLPPQTPPRSSEFQLPSEEMRPGTSVPLLQGGGGGSFGDNPTEPINMLLVGLQ